MKKILAVSIALALVGCAMGPRPGLSAVDADKGTYQIVTENITSSKDLYTARGESRDKARAFCEERGENIQFLATITDPGSAEQNGTVMISVVFRCHPSMTESFRK